MADTYEDVIRLTENMVNDTESQKLARSQGLQILNVTWEDTGRFKGSAVGPNISDMTIQVQRRLPGSDQLRPDLHARHPLPQLLRHHRRHLPGPVLRPGRQREGPPPGEDQPPPAPRQPAQLPARTRAPGRATVPRCWPRTGTATSWSVPRRASCRSPRKASPSSIPSCSTTSPEPATRRC